MTQMAERREFRQCVAGWKARQRREYNVAGCSLLSI